MQMDAFYSSLLHFILSPYFKNFQGLSRASAISIEPTSPKVHCITLPFTTSKQLSQHLLIQQFPTPVPA